jgi:hypothetical protein
MHAMSPEKPPEENPFASPQAEVEGVPPVTDPRGGQFAPCPRCGCTTARVPMFTWWGGALGHRLLNHVFCCQCGYGYNGRSGQSNTAGILLYNAVGLVAIAVLLALFFLMG